MVEEKTHCYEEDAIRIKDELGAQLVALMVVDGKKGTGFICISKDPVLMCQAVDALRGAADQLEDGLDPRLVEAVREVTADAQRKPS